MLFILFSKSKEINLDEEILQWMTLYWLHLKRASRRLYCVHKINQHRRLHVEYLHVMEEILVDEENCVQYTRIKPATFLLLLSKVGSHLDKGSGFSGSHWYLGNHLKVRYIKVC